MLRIRPLVYGPVVLGTILATLGCNAPETGPTEADKTAQAERDKATADAFKQSQQRPR